MNKRKILDLINIIVLLYIWAVSAIQYPSLSESIPTHFGFDGNPDSYSSKLTLFTIPAIATALFFLLKYLSGNPDSPLLNIPDKMRQNRKLTAVFVRVMLFYVLLLFADIATEVPLIAKGNYEKLSPASSIIIGLMFLSVIGYFFYARKKLQQID